MISEVMARNDRFEELESRLKTLKEDWSEVVAHPDYGIHVAFDVLEKQVERAIRSCGYSISESQSDDARATMGDKDIGLVIFYCNPGVMVIISYSFQRVVFMTGDKDTEMRLRDIRAVSV